MQQATNREINFYTAYQRGLRLEKPSSGRSFLVFVPIAALLIGLVAVALVLVSGNAKKQAQLDEITAMIASSQEEYDAVLALSDDRDQIADIDFNLEATLLYALSYPAPDKTVFDRVAECAEDGFFITNYRFSETTGTLELDAVAPSVNLVPNLVNRLRDTGLFSAVQYAGYTSDSDTQYYCTVGCTLEQ